jgi:hypothetical protein
MDILPHGIIARLRNGKNLVDYDWVWVWSIDTISIADTRLGTEYISVCFDDVFLADVPMRKGVVFRRRTYVVVPFWRAVFVAPGRNKF